MEIPDPRSYVEIYLCDKCDWEGLSEAKAKAHSDVTGHFVFYEDDLDQ